MLARIVHFSLQFRGVVIALACVMLGYGVYTSFNSKLDVFPNFVQPQVEIQTECPGLSPEQVETLVTLPVETAVSGLGDMESLRSESIQGLSIVTAVFKEGTDVFIARQLLAEKIAELTGKMPDGVKAPRLTPLTSSTMDLLKIGLVSGKLTPMELRTFADWTLKPRLLAVPGVAKCSVFGGDVRQLQIRVHPDRLATYGLSLQDVLAAGRVSTGLRGAGFIETAQQRITLQAEGQAITPDVLGEVVITWHEGRAVRLKDVATVAEGAEPKFGGTVIQGGPGVLLTMSSQYGANTLEVTERLEKALAEMSPTILSQGITLYPGLHRPATFIETSLRGIRSSLLLGGLCVAVVLFLFLGHFRTAFISLTAIPLSLIGAIIALDKMGVTLNTITLGGLAIAIGEVVDDAIIDVENIFRRLREAQLKKEASVAASSESAGNSRLKLSEIFSIILNASLEVRSAVVYATFVVALVFLPVLTLTGLQGSFFAPLALSYILAIMVSLVVALTVTPALSFIMFQRGVRDAREPRLQKGLKAIYGRILSFVSRRPRTIIAGVVVVCALLAGALVIAKFPIFAGEFLPEFREGHFVLHVSAVPGTSLPEMLRIGRQVSNELLKIKSIASVEQQAGRAELGEDPWGPQRSEFHVELQPSIAGEEQEQLANQLKDLLKKFPGIQFKVETFLGDRLGETIAGETSPVVVNIFGDDLDLLDAKAQEVRRVLAKVPGHGQVEIKAPPGSPRMAIYLRPDRLTQLGYRSLEVLEVIQAAYQGAIVAQTQRGNQFADVAVVLDDKQRQDPETIGELLVQNSHGTRMPLRELADIYPTTGRHSILHEGARRRQTITCDPSGVDVTTFVDAARQAVASKVKFSGGMYIVFSGAAEAKAKATRQIILHSAIAGVGILLLLGLAFHNWRHLLLVLANVPFALVGGVLTVYLTGVFGEPGGAGLTIGSLVGFVTLFGITMRNSIMMISHFEHLVVHEGMVWGPEAAVRGASERLIPILMTALVTALGLLPLALGTGEAGREIEGPMATVILGGLATSTLLNLVVLPALALRYGKFASVQQQDGGA